MLIAFHKPYGILSQFTPDGSRYQPLAGFGFPAGVYPLGRLDADSEGLLLLSDEPGLNTRLLDPSNAHWRTYRALVERVPDEAALAKLCSGILLENRKTLPAEVCIPDPQPIVPPRSVPVRFRKNVQDIWIELRLQEGRNRQVRRMTAAVGHPTLRLQRVAIGKFSLGELPPGEWKELHSAERVLIFS